MANEKEVMVKMVLDTWFSRVKETDKWLSQLSDAQLAADVSPGKNSGHYLLGHLVAAHDGMLPLLGMGEALHPQLREPFLMKPDKSGAAFPSLDTLRAMWTEVSAKLDEAFRARSAEEWFQRHNSVSAEDFEKEPHRNRLNVVMSRAVHLAYHNGQLALLKKD